VFRSRRSQHACETFCSQLKLLFTLLKDANPKTGLPNYAQTPCFTCYLGCNAWTCVRNGALPIRSSAFNSKLRRLVLFLSVVVLSCFNMFIPVDSEKIQSENVALHKAPSLILHDYSVTTEDSSSVLIHMTFMFQLCFVVPLKHPSLIRR